MEPTTYKQVSVNDIETEVTSISENIKWHKQTFTFNIFVKKRSLIKYVCTPMEYIKKYFSDELFDLIALCTNQYYMKTTGKSLKTSFTEMKQF